MIVLSQKWVKAPGTVIRRKTVCKIDARVDHVWEDGLDAVTL